jgi:hypothetical protein
LILGIGARPCHAEKLFDKTARKQLTAYLLEICNWIGAANTPDDVSRRKKDDNGSIVINAYFARTLLAGSEYAQNPKEVQEVALKWCDTFAKRLTPVVTRKGTPGGYWLDHGPSGDLNLTSAATAAYTLVLACSRTEGPRKQEYLAALQKYAVFILEGSAKDALKKGQAEIPSWMIMEGKDQGAFSAGVEAQPGPLLPSSASTAAHVALMAGLSHLTPDSRYREAANRGMEWLLKSRRANGETPFLEKGEEDDERLLRSAGYLGEAILACYYQLGNPQLNEKFSKILGPTLRWLVLAQGERGWWGEGENRLGSPGIANLLYWDLQFGTKSQQLPEALSKYWEAITNPVHRQTFGVMVSGLPSGLVALSIAETLKPGSTFR